MKKVISIILTGTIGLGTLFLTTVPASAAEIQIQQHKLDNSYHVQLNTAEEFYLSGRSIDIISGDTSSVKLRRNIISFTKSGIYVVKMNGCIADEYHTFIVTK
ncbi:hypothetical protein [Bacillus wiedmannii]|uniref:hypothetical protein n=1 Tax=Bacillus wiedmannii TaxID=1890302 RepID=UPI000BF056CF|nr:hypothetical protein [Bacillus wiedmannii]PEO39937.1 hypothetical protein CN555_06440 [Bacillus wiedmannii]